MCNRYIIQIENKLNIIKYIENNNISYKSNVENQLFEIDGNNLKIIKLKMNKLIMMRNAKILYSKSITSNSSCNVNIILQIWLDNIVIINY